MTCRMRDFFLQFNYLPVIIFHIFEISFQLIKWI